MEKSNNLVDGDNKEVKIAKITARQAIILAIITATVSVFTSLISVWPKLSKVEGDQLNNKNDIEGVQSVIRSDSVIHLYKKIPLGTIITSILDYADFCKSLEMEANFKSQSSKWAPADGRQIMESDFQRMFDKSHAPDLRGQFLRGANNFSNTGAPSKYANGNDPNESERKLDPQGYSYQDFKTATPQNDFIFSVSGGGHYHLYGRSEPVRKYNGEDKILVANADETRRNNLSIKTSDDDLSELTVKTIDGGDDETRPKNIQVFYYLKINN